MMNDKRVLAILAMELVRRGLMTRDGEPTQRRLFMEEPHS